MGNIMVLIHIMIPQLALHKHLVLIELRLAVLSNVLSIFQHMYKMELYII